MAIDLQVKQQLAKMLARPSSVTEADAGLLTKLVKTYPYYQPLHLLLAKAQNDPQRMANATLYNSGVLLHKTLHHTDAFVSKPVKLVVPKQPKPSFATASEDVFEEIAEANASRPTTIQEGWFDAPELNEEKDQENDVFEEIADIGASPFFKAEEKNEIILSTNLPEETTLEDEVFEEIAEVGAGPTVQNAEEKIDQENQVFEEITEAVLPPSREAERASETVPTIIAAQELGKGNEAVETLTDPTPDEEAAPSEILPDELAIGAIVANDFFAFEQNFSIDQTANLNTVPVSFTPLDEHQSDAEKQKVSKYDDDKLPYTFLWWLAKTRKEHAQIFQPYVTAKKQGASVAGELQHQYVEHIFHLQTPFNITEEANKVTEQAVSHKGGDIIDSFIKNEPQISAPKGDQINNENKAKKSAEDNYDLVSETLAAIYVEQMLYHKAIDTYEKLSLKFPEKSRYFADLIQSLEKKI